MTEPVVVWKWGALADELEHRPWYIVGDDGWIAQDLEEGLHLVVHQAPFGKALRLEWGSLSIELDCGSWEEGKESAETVLKHARALVEAL
jgi:hypothetical protein